ncbi:BON domain-containing protein [Alkalilimnicola sp. S0819]|uniref:BON domain-containing protein n=1 Tax=Alkalilimnicola sp. S0819 TaxID=2613922 RepID=UPI00186977A9|nr:BON domain-containing protein [Alkalilimnicola sp. S0819]
MKFQHPGHCVLAFALIIAPIGVLAEDQAKREQSEIMKEYSTDAIAGSEQAQLADESLQQDEQQAGAADETTENGEQRAAAPGLEHDTEEGITAEDQASATAPDSDEALMERISRKLTEDDQLQAVLIEVDAEAGTVNLRGAVGSEADRDRVMQLVRETEGVQTVEADLRVNETATAALGGADQTAETFSESDSPVGETAAAPTAPRDDAEATAEAPTIIDAEESELPGQG